MTRTLKYTPVTSLLKNRRGETVKIAFGTLDRVVDGLPYSARAHAAWWYGSFEGTPTHAHKRAWEDAGFTILTVDLDAERATFTRF